MAIGCDQPYKMSFVVGGLFLNESRDVAELYSRLKSWEVTLQIALQEGMSSLPKETSRRRTLREIVDRTSTLNDNELAFLAEKPDRGDQQLLLWLAACRQYRFVREFAAEVIRERFLSLKLDLPLESFDTFFEAKAEWDDRLADISASTRLKLRQVLFRIMREAGIITQENKILATYISPQLHKIIVAHAPTDLLLLPSTISDGGIT